mmetsp:Transcript_43219/g.112120  ORF Transcript_43219/g.112120 Transcript_43219/m.112120 type:complete len:1402 (+) Transcript_43219:207-4412(+)
MKGSLLLCLSVALWAVLVPTSAQEITLKEAGPVSLTLTLNFPTGTGSAAFNVYYNSMDPGCTQVISNYMSGKTTPPSLFDGVLPLSGAWIPATVPTSTYTITGLQPGTAYGMALVGVNSVYSPVYQSSLEGFTTTDLPAPIAVLADALSATSAEVSWQIPTNISRLYHTNPINITYHVDYYEIDPTPCFSRFSTSVPGTSSSVILSALVPSGAYKFEVYSETNGVTSEKVQGIVTLPTSPNITAVDREPLLEVAAGFDNDILLKGLGTRDGRWGWDDLCKWYGVTCNSFGRVVGLNLSTVAGPYVFNLGGTLSPAIGQLTELVRVSFQGQQIGGELPAELANLTKLEEIELKNNKFSGQIPPILFQSWSNLLIMEFGQNSLGGYIPPDIRMYKMQRFYLYNNEIEGTIPSTITRMRSIERLNVGANRLSGGIPYFTQADFPNMTFFGCSDNGITAPGFPTQFCDIPKLDKLQLSGVVLTGSGPELNFPSCLGHLSNLQSINADEMGVTGDIPATFMSLYNMEVLSLFQNTLTGGVENLCNMSKLEALDLSRNSISGSLPSCFGDMQNLVYFKLNENKFEDEFPYWIKNIKLQMFNIFDNFFYGDLTNAVFYPPGNCSLTHFIVGGNQLSGVVGGFDECSGSLLFLILAENKFRNPFPSLNGSFAGLQKIDISGNEFSGAIPSVLLNAPNLVDFQTARNGYHSNLEVLCQLSFLDTIDISNNSFSGTFPPCFQTSEKLESVNVADNLFSNIDALILNENIQILTASSCNVTGPLPYMSKNSFTSLILSENPINMEISDMFDRLKGDTASSLVSLELSMCGLYGGISPVDFSFLRESVLSEQGNALNTRRVIDRVPVFEKLRSMDLSSNKLNGFLPTINTLEQIDSLDLSNNEFVGEIPEAYSAVRLLKLDNTYIQSSRKQLPSFLTLRPSDVQKNDTFFFTCPGIVNVIESRSSSVDAFYLDYTHCTCNDGRYGLPPNCYACPVGTECTGGNLRVQPGYWAPPEALHNVSLNLPTNFTALICYDDKLGSNPCNPPTDDEQECKLGYGGRLCSLCVNASNSQYFRVGRECRSCVQLGFLSLGDVLPAIYALLVVGLAAYLILKPVSTSASGLVKSFTTFLQIVSYLKTSGITWPSDVNNLLEVEETASLSISAFECLLGTDVYTKRVLITLALPIATLLITFIMYWFGVVIIVLKYKVLEVRRKKRKYWKGKCYFMVLYITSLLYISMCRTVLMSFSCHTPPDQEGEPITYMTWEPSLVCPFYASSSIHWIFAVTLSALFVYILGLPIIYIILLRRSRQKSESIVRTVSTNFLCAAYKDEYYWWDIVVKVKKFIFVALMVLPPPGSAVMPIGVFGVVLFFALLESVVRPFKAELDNKMEVAAMYLTLIIYFLGMLLMVDTIEQ